MSTAGVPCPVPNAQQCPAQCPLAGEFHGYNPCPGAMENVPAARDYERGFKMSLMVKDLEIGSENRKNR